MASHDIEQHAWMCLILWYWTACTQLDSLLLYSSPPLSLFLKFSWEAELASEGWDRGSLECICAFHVPHCQDTHQFQQQPQIFPDLCGIASVPVETFLIAFQSLKILNSRKTLSFIIQSIHTKETQILLHLLLGECSSTFHPPVYSAFSSSF